MSETVVVPTRGRGLPLLFAFVGIPIVALLGFFWLEIPDSHIWQLAVSLVTGVLIAAAFIWLVASAVRAIRNAPSPCSVWLSATLVAVWMLIKWLFISAVSKLNDNQLQRAGYWNSKLSAHMRVTFTSDRLFAWQQDVALLLVWVVMPLLLTPFVVETVSRGVGIDVWRVAARTMIRWQHGLAVIVCDAAVYWLTGKLTGWRPSHSVHGELISLAFRLSFIYIADFALIVLLFAIDSWLLAREYARRYAVVQPSTNIP